MRTVQHVVHSDMTAVLIPEFVNLPLSNLSQCNEKDNKTDLITDSVGEIQWAKKISGSISLLPHVQLKDPFWTVLNQFIWTVDR